MSKFCPNCGEKVEDSIAFCPECGQQFEKVGQAFGGQPQSVGQQPVQAQPQQPVQQNPYQPAQPQQPVQQNPYQPVQPQQPMNNGYNPYGQPGFQQPGYQQPQYGGYNAMPKPDNIIQAFKWTTYTGRLNRQRYFLRGLAFGAMAFVLAMIGAMLGLAMELGEDAVEGLCYLACLPVFVLSFMNTMKRAHDLDKPGWWAVGTLIPVINFVLSLYFLFAKGTEGPNQYGDDPLMFP